MSPLPGSQAEDEEASTGQHKHAQTVNTDTRRPSHYTGEMKEVIDAACTLLSIYLYVNHAFPKDEVPPLSTMESGGKDSVKWQAVLDHFFNGAVDENPGASALSMYYTPSVSPSSY